jgi:hypothetical protein
MDKKVNIPKKGAAKKWSERLKQIGEQPPSKDLMDILNQTEDQKKTAPPSSPSKDLDKVPMEENGAERLNGNP